jgi:hypothetical protein
MMRSDDLAADFEPADAEELLPLAERLRAACPVPRASFRGDLRRRLDARAPHFNQRVRIMIGGFAASGAGLLVIGALGAAGTQPFG